MKVKDFLRWYFIIPASLLLFLIMIFAGWYLVPAKTLDIVVLNKTVPANKVDKYNQTAGDYRKHLGLFWLLTQQKYKNPDTNKLYNYKTDYYGPLLNGQKVISHRQLERMDKTPDVIYIADAYGDQTSKDSSAKGISYANMNVISTALNNGSTIIGESDIVSVSTEDSVKAELQTIFGIQYSEWTGRYIYDMQDFSDIPEWALSLHEQEYGRQWDYKGSGILLVSQNGEIIILEENSDFNSSNLMSVSVTDEYKGQFGNLKQNYYNWFEIIEADYGTDVIAEYQFDLNESGKQKFSKISQKSVFPAVTRKHHAKSPAYYYAGDFNDYVARERYPKFLFSHLFYRFFSYDRKGDITNFYWKFFVPLMQTTLKEVLSNRENLTEVSVNTVSQAKIENNQFSVQVNGKWQPLKIKGFNINAVMPGAQPYDYTRDISVYQKLISEVAGMGGNCIRAYDLMPPEFYRALSEHNMKNPGQIIYFMQSIIPPDSLTKGEYNDRAPREEILKNVGYVVDAVHGKGNVPKVGSRNDAIYVNDVSGYLIGYLVDMNMDKSTVNAINAKNAGYTYQGKYVSAQSNPSEAFVASICDYLLDYQYKTYGHLSPVGAAGNQELLPSAAWAVSGGASFDISRLTISDAAAGNFFVSYSLQPMDSIFLDNMDQFKGYTDTQGEFLYGGYIRAVKKLQTRYPVLIDRFGLPTNMNAFEKEETVNGLTEQDQGEGLVRMLKAIDSQGYLGGLISDLNDSWSNYSEEMAKFTVPLRDNPLWHNMLDQTQNFGVLAVNPVEEDEPDMILKDVGRMQEMQLSVDQAYLYITVVLEKEVDYDKEQLIIGLDTYQRNNGEYLFDPKYYANSLSGMEYVVKFESKSSAAIYVTPSYNRNKKAYNSKESYTGKFDYIAQLSYGNFESVNNHFYQTGSTVHIRIPWSLLNFTNPTKKMVINDTRTAAEVDADPFQIQTTATNGILFSLLIADKSTKDTVYIFPESKQSNGYKTFSWHNWEKTDFIIERKKSYNILLKYFSQN